MRFRLGTLIAVILCIALAAPLLMHAFRSSRSKNSVVSALRGIHAIRHAEEEVRSNDLDGNRELDYWTRDVRGLAQFRILDSSITSADGRHREGEAFHFHFFVMVDRAPDGRPLADPSGCGPRFILQMLPDDRKGRMWGWDSDNPKLYGNAYDDSRVMRWPAAPSAEGWGIVD